MKIQLLDIEDRKSPIIGSSLINCTEHFAEIADSFSKTGLINIENIPCMDKPK